MTFGLSAMATLISGTDHPNRSTDLRRLMSKWLPIPHRDNRRKADWKIDQFHVINPGELVCLMVSKEFDNNDLISGKDPGQGRKSSNIRHSFYIHLRWPGPLADHHHRCEDNPQVTLVDNEYDHLGRLCANKRNGNQTCEQITIIISVRGPNRLTLFSQTLYYQDDYARTQTSSHFNTFIQRQYFRHEVDRRGDRRQQGVCIRLWRTFPTYKCRLFREWCVC